MQSKKNNPSEGSKIAVMKFSALGDIAASLPFIRAMDQPPCIITSPLGKAFLEDEFSDFIILKDKSFWSLLKLIHTIRNRNFSDLIDLQGNDRCRFIDRLSGTTAHNAYDDRKPPAPSELVTSIRAKMPVRQMFKKKPRDYIVFNTGSSEKWAAKRPPIEKWKEFAEIVNARFGLPIKLPGSADEAAYVAAIAKDLPGDIETVAGKTSLTGLKHLLRNAYLTVSTDSAALHISSVEKTPTIGIFGSTTWEEKAQFPWCIALYDKILYPDGNMPVCTAEIKNYYAHIDLSEGLDALAEYLD